MTINGLDRKGLIKEVSEAMYQHGASITTSKMMSLGEEFSIMMHIECDPAKMNDVPGLLSDISAARRCSRKKHGLDISALL